MPYLPEPLQNEKGTSVTKSEVMSWNHMSNNRYIYCNIIHSNIEICIKTKKKKF